MQPTRIFVLACILVFMYCSIAVAGGECPMHSSMAAASTGDGKVGLQLQYEYTYMKTLREGSDSTTPDKVLDNKMSDPATMRFSVPTEMIMKKYTLAANYAPSDKFQLVLAVPYVVNDMDMRMAMRMGMMVTKSDSSMDTVDGLGDITLMGLYNLYSDSAIKPAKSISVGLGIKTPTGDDDVKKSNGDLVHAMMQPGTGSWDPLFLINALHSMEALSFQFNGMYHLTTKGKEGYEFGDMVSADVIARYKALQAFSLGLGLNFIHAAKDKDHDGKFSKPATSMIDNTENTGITAFYLSPELRVKFLNTGGSFLIRYQKPIYQHVNGIQQVVDWRAMTALTWAF